MVYKGIPGDPNYSVNGTFMGPILRLKRFFGLENSNVLFSMFMDIPINNQESHWVEANSSFDFSMWWEYSIAAKKKENFKKILSV